VNARFSSIFFADLRSGNNGAIWEISPFHRNKRLPPSWVFTTMEHSKRLHHCALHAWFCLSLGL